MVDDHYLGLTSNQSCYDIPWPTAPDGRVTSIVSTLVFG